MTQSLTYSNFKIYLDNQGEGEKNPLVEYKSNSRYIFTLPTPILLAAADEHRIVVGVESASIPLSFYTVNATNDKLYISTTTMTTTLTLDHGNYNVSNFMSHLNTTLHANTETVDLNAIFNERTSTIRFYTNNPTHRPDLFFNIGPNSAKNLIGLEDNISHSMPYTCHHSINLTYTTGVSVRCNNIQTINQDTSSDNAGATTLLRIPINTAPNTVLTHFNPNPFLTTINTKTLTHLDIGLYDDNQHPLQIHKHAWFIVLRVDFVKTTDYFLDKTKIQGMRAEAEASFGEEETEDTEDTEETEETMTTNPLSHMGNVVLQEYEIPTDA
jgi:hypothetical protein